MSTRRKVRGELMDDPRADRAELTRALRYLGIVNATTGGHHAVLSRLRRWSRAWTPDREVRILDLGAGGADTAIAIDRWARARGHRVRITAVDVHPTTLDIARQRTRPFDAIECVLADAKDFVDRSARRSFDYALASLFLHHLDDADAAHVLAGMERLARAGVIWTDLLRSPLQRAIVSLCTIGQGPMVRHDAVASVDAGFTRPEAERMARDAALHFCRFSGTPLWYRFVVAGERDGAWKRQG